MMAVEKCSDILFTSIFMVVRVLFLEQLKADPRHAGSYMNRIKGELNQSLASRWWEDLILSPAVCLKLIWCQWCRERHHVNLNIFCRERFGRYTSDNYLFQLLSLCSGLSWMKKGEVCIYLTPGVYLSVLWLSEEEVSVILITCTLLQGDSE